MGKIKVQKETTPGKTSQIAPPRPAPLMRKPQQAPTSALQRKTCACGGEFGADGQCPACRARRQAIQRKMTVNQPGDAYEQEADQVARQVMRQADEPGKVRSATMRPTMQRQTQPPSVVPEVTPEIETSIQSARGGGQAMPPDVQRKMGDSFGADFGGVRIHQDSRADLLNRQLDARAFATGNDIFFKHGEYNPNSRSGQQLLAHELSHVVQQGEGDARSSGNTEAIQRDATNQSITPSQTTGGVPSLNAIPEGGEVVDQVGIVNWDGNPEVKLRATPDTTAVNIITTLPFNTHLQVIKRFSGGWFLVSTPDGELGYLASEYVWTHLPEPNARLHRVESGLSGTAIGIAENYYGQYADDWGQDLRFYVNVLAWANRIDVPNTTGGWRQVRFRAGNLIWIPSHDFAHTLKGVVNSGSYSYNILDAIGLAGFIERVGELWDDFKHALSLSKKYLVDAIARHVEQALMNVIYSLALMLITAIAILAISTAIGAAIGALAGGVGAAPGAAAGFKVGMVILDWLGVGMFIVWIGQALGETASAFGSFLGTVWDARGNERLLDQAAFEFAEAIGTLLGKLLEFVLLYAVSVGLGKALGAISGTRFGKMIGASQLGKWVRARMQEVKSGRTPIPTPRRALRYLLVRRVRVEMLKKADGHPASSLVEKISQTMERHAQEVFDSLMNRTANSPEAQSAYKAIDAGRDWSGSEFGKAFEAELNLRLQKEVPGLVYQRQVAVPQSGLTHRQPGRPDWRLNIGQALEAVWDATMLGGPSQGKALTKYDTSWNRFIGEILYPRPPHVGDVPSPIIVTPPVPQQEPEANLEEE